MVPSMLRGESLKRLLQGVVVGVVLTVVVGFNWFHYGFGWMLGGTAEKVASERVDVALVAAYTPVFAKVESWRRDDYVKKAGLATIPGGTAPNSSVADACAGVLTKLLDARAAKK